MSQTGATTPFSTSSTLTNSPILKEKETQLASSFLSPATAPGASLITSAAAVLESIASRNSEVVFGYDTAHQFGVGDLTKEWSKTGSGATYVEMQNRSGAGLTLAGRLGQGTSSKKDASGVISAYTTPEGLSQMAPSLASLPAASSSGRVVLQVPAIFALEPSLTLTSSLAPLSTSIPILPEGFSVVLSSSAQETADLAAVLYNVPESHIVHIFDQYAAAREVRRISYPGVNLLSPAASVEQALLQTGYSLFDYHGSATAKTVFVVLKGLLSSVLEAIADKIPEVGVVSVRVLRPWNAEKFLQVLPQTASTIQVIDEVLHEGSTGLLYEDVFGTVVASRPDLSVQSRSFTPAKILELASRPSELISLVAASAKSSSSAGVQYLYPTNLKKLLFYGTSSTPLTTLPTVVAQSFVTTPGLTARLSTDFDAFSKAGGVSVSRVLISSDDAAAQNLPAKVILPDQEAEGTADFTAVLDQALLKTHDVLHNARPKSVVLVFSQWTPEEAAANLATASAELARQKGLAIYTLNSKAISESLAVTDSESKQVMENVLGHLAFLRLYAGASCTETKLTKTARALFGEKIAGVDVAKVASRLWSSIFQVPISAAPAVDAPDAPAKPLKSFEFNAVELESFRGLDIGDHESTSLGSWRDAAKNIIFREAYGLPRPDTLDSTQQDPALRPDLEDRTFLVTCSVNRRLTPLSYDRNVFHLEFDTAGTGLKYAIGEALGVHGWNDADEVKDFCAWYGLDPSAVVNLPVPSPNRGPGLRQTRTVFQTLQQQVDIFGRPPKSFYSALAEHAKSKDHRLALRFIGAAEGSATFKKLSEVDTVTFADVLKMYDSCRPDFATLCELVGDIKPRHYSIASSQAAVGDRVDLLVVTVDWVNPSGSPRFGQCTRYLAALKPGQQVTVSIKPSVMKLPPDNMQPIIMAGLGTGAAPFRAFIQHRAWLKSQNIPIGPLIYYFGSRHRSQEYLYGEELEAYLAEGIITHAGFAFSRDQKQKIYIQHKMLEDGEMLAAMLGGKGEGALGTGVFYLCGPTWPVPDVFEALIGALSQYAGFTRENAMGYIEELKEEERYVLEDGKAVESLHVVPLLAEDSAIASRICSDYSHPEQLPLSNQPFVFHALSEKGQIIGKLDLFQVVYDVTKKEIKPKDQMTSFDVRELEKGT
ncbi:hypothetical protein FRB90_004414 [Tulasnella sp. 427]|nr:hypothetical protein FRB90_004414 [Tulasnella sp. 427]